MKRIVLWSFVFSLAAIAPSVFAQDADKPADAEGCKDSPLIVRMPGSVIQTCENKEFEQFTFQVSKDKDGNIIEKKLEGEFHSWDYGTREGVSEIQVFRNFETALKQGGFKIVYEDSPSTITAQKGDTWFALQNAGSFYYQTIVTAKQMTQEVTADASSLAEAINKVRTVPADSLFVKIAQSLGIHLGD